MKKTIAILTVLLVMAVLFASCSHGGGSGEGEAAKAQAVKVSLVLGGDVAEAAQKAVSLNGGAIENGYTFWYKAVPQWAADRYQGRTSDNAAADDNGFVKLTDKTLAQMTATATDGVSLGYFTRGIWKFDVEIRASNGTTIIYKANDAFKSANVSVGTADPKLVANMVLNTSGNNGKVTFKIAVPKISADTNLTLTYGSETEDFTGVTVLAKKPTALNTLVEAANWLYYEKVLTVAPGNYDFELSYNEGTKIGGAIVSMTVLPGVEDYVIWGTIENGEYQVASLRLIVPSVEITALTPSVSAVAGFVTVAKDDELTFTYPWSLQWYISDVLRWWS